MKKTRIIAIALAVAVALMGAGYAAWTQNVIVTGTVNTGELSMNISQEKYNTRFIRYELSKNDGSGNVAWHFPTDQELVDYGLIGTADNPNHITSPGVIDNVDSTITFTYNNMFPGLKAYQKYKITNNGTIPVKLKNVSFISATGELKDSPHIKAFIDLGNNFDLYSVDKPFSEMTDENLVAIDQDLKDIVINVGEYLNIRVGAYLDKDAENDVTENKDNNTFGLNIEFVQANLQEYPNGIQ